MEKITFSQEIYSFFDHHLSSISKNFSVAYPLIFNELPIKLNGKLL